MLKEKQKGKKRKLYHFSDLIKDFNFYDYITNFKYFNFTGTAYYLENANNEKIKEVINKYDNVIKLKAKSEYAPEQEKILLFISNK